MVLKDKRQMGLGTYSEIQISCGFDINEILQSHHKKLKKIADNSKQKFEKETFSVTERTIKIKKSIISTTKSQTSGKDLIEAEDDSEEGITLLDIRNFLKFS
jgi:hypothetical protein